MLGLTFQGSGLGRWEPTGKRSGRFTLLQPLSDADGGRSAPGNSPVIEGK